MKVLSLGFNKKGTTTDCLAFFNAPPRAKSASLHSLSTLITPSFVDGSATLLRVSSTSFNGHGIFSNTASSSHPSTTSTRSKLPYYHLSRHHPPFPKRPRYLHFRHHLLSHYATILHATILHATILYATTRYAVCTRVFSLKPWQFYHLVPDRTFFTMSLFRPYLLMQ